MTTETMTLESIAEIKELRLKAILAEYPTIAVAFSGGVDSTYLADVAHEVLGAKSCMIIADSPSIPRSELREAVGLAEGRGWGLRVVNTTEFENESYLANDGRRCYFCKSELFKRMKDYADSSDVEVLAYGAMADDKFDPTRLGHLAATEHRVVAPLQEAELGKDEIRHLSRRRNLPTAAKASFACLASRFPTGTRVTLEDIQKIEQAEEVLKAEGFYQYRARHHGDTCRIEVDQDDIARILDPEVRDRVVSGVTAAGYKHVTVDLAGYRTGSSATMTPAANLLQPK